MPVFASPDFSRRLFLGSTAVACLVAGFGAARAAGTVKPDAKSALIVVDVQNCFIDGGTLPVKGGAAVVPVITRLAASFENIVVTQDWHTPGHASFASTHAGKKPFETTSMPYGAQVLWPDHCVQGSDDAALHKDLKLPTARLIIRVDAALLQIAREPGHGLAAYVVEDATRAIDLNGSLAAAWKQMTDAGVKRIQSSDIA
jgi:nicotinamidase/pyrazinamidase